MAVEADERQTFQPSFCRSLSSSSSSSPPALINACAGWKKKGGKTDCQWAGLCNAVILVVVEAIKKDFSWDYNEVSVASYLSR